MSKKKKNELNWETVGFVDPDSRGSLTIPTLLFGWPPAVWKKTSLGGIDAYATQGCCPNYVKLAVAKSGEFFLETEANPNGKQARARAEELLIAAVQQRSKLNPVPEVEVVE